MGSTRRSEFIRARRGRPSKSSQTKAILHDVLEQFGKALSMLEATARAFEAAQNDGQCSGTGAEVATLRQGVTALQAIHEAFDRAIAQVSR